MTRELTTDGFRIEETEEGGTFICFGECKVDADVFRGQLSGVLSKEAFQLWLLRQSYVKPKADAANINRIVRDLITGEHFLVVGVAGTHEYSVYPVRLRIQSEVQQTKLPQTIGSADVKVVTEVSGIWAL